MAECRAKEVGAPRWRGRSPTLALALCCALAASCGGSSHSQSTAPTAQHAPSVAARVCGAGLRTAQAFIGAAAQMQVADSDPANIECLLHGEGIRLDVTAQASPLAWTEYDTTVVHLAQAFGSPGVHEPSHLPHPVPGLGGNATWVPAQGELVATNGTQSTGGSYVTTTVTRSSPHGPASLTVATAVTRATLASAPRGSNPGPPPS